MLSFSSFQLSAKPLLLVGEKSRLTKDFVTKLLQLDARATARLSLASKVFTANCESIVEHSSGADRQVRLAYLSDKTSRQMGVLRQDLLPKLISSNLPSPEEPCQVVLCLKHKDELFAASSALAKAFPLYSRKAANLKKLEAQIDVSFLLPDEQVEEAQLKDLEVLADSVRCTQSLVDMPPTDLDPKAYWSKIQDYVKDVPHVTAEAIIGEELKAKGLNVIYSVGKAAVNPAHLVILQYNPPAGDKAKTVAFVGKGITYDTGGLSIKSTAGMCNMKTDMGGSAACLGAFLYLAKTNCQHPVVATLCLAENAVGPKSLKNDDIVTAFSGKTIEINNTDAEGRLVLADGVAYTSQTFKPAVMLDIATLTGAQMVAAGQLHAGILAPTEELEHKLVAAGRESGDLTTPLVYAPEVLFDEFKSELADMKNSVADRMNAQSSCAGHFIEQHVAEGCTWAHIDMAGPSTFKNGCAAGYGVGLLSKFAHNWHA